eukprot:gene56234-41643_t
MGTFSTATGNVLYSRVRLNLSRHLHTLVLRRRHLYRLVTVHGHDVDNYDQRISDDIDSF